MPLDFGFLSLSMLCDGGKVNFFLLTSNWQCDGEKDCDDGSDEANCTITTTATPITTPTTEKQCSELMFKCDNGHCIPFWWRCDELDDCGDASDEDGCPSHGHGFHGNSTTQRPETTTIAHTCQKVSGVSCNSSKKTQKKSKIFFKFSYRFFFKVS